MALTNSQYDAIMRDYDARQTLSRLVLQERTDKVYSAIPEYKELLDTIGELSVEAAKCSIMGDNEAMNKLQSDIEAIKERLSDLLASNGFPKDYLTATYTCSLCQDTGYINNEKCSCFRQATIDLLYKQSNLSDMLNDENFDTFSLNYYSNEVTDPVTGLTPYNNAKKVLAICKDYVNAFPSGDNILFYGDTGVGKTFLSNCIAKALLDKTHSVLYMSAIDLFKNLIDNSVGSNNGDMPPLEQQVLTCDLLIIDDLGTELVNSYTNSKLFHCINNRLQNNLSTVISTNFTLQQLMDTYSERIFSRISSSYKLIKLFGDDIRLIKK